MPRVIHFEIHADDPQRAVKFYSGVFGWEVQKWTEPTDYWLLMTGKDEPGINGAIMKREKPLSGSGDIMAFVCTISIDSVEKYSSKIEAAGGKILVPKGPIPGIGWFAQCLDTEGNVFGILQNDPSAK
ncbi:MAG TPA: VOC family protein [bacterium]|jgi:predicted enzyme related to lactoylglutathione lyase